MGSECSITSFSKISTAGGLFLSSDAILTDSMAGSLKRANSILQQGNYSVKLIFALWNFNQQDINEPLQLWLPSDSAHNAGRNFCKTKICLCYFT